MDRFQHFLVWSKGYLVPIIYSSLEATLGCRIVSFQLSLLSHLAGF